jgi:hypothetical protein
MGEQCKTRDSDRDRDIEKGQNMNGEQCHMQQAQNEIQWNLERLRSFLREVIGRTSEAACRAVLISITPAAIHK